MMSYSTENRFIKISIIFSFISLALGGLFGLIQLLARTPYILNIDPQIYYMVLTGHGVLMAIVWTAFFIMGIAVFVTTRVLKVNLNKVLLNSSLILSLIGTILAAIAILSGQANVLYTFYPPLKAHPLFYLGAAILVIGTWIFAVAIFLAFLSWRKSHKKEAIPLPIYGVIATLIVWLEATPGLAIEVLKDLIPMSLFGSPVDVLEARTYFWYFGHPLVYFWLIPAITLWYFTIPRILNTELFSETMAKVVFILFIITSTPVGIHHQLVDTGIDPSYKYLHTVLTYTVAIASFLTAFNIIATLEKSYREKGGRKLFGWIKNQPWNNPVFASLGLAFIIFGLGGIGGIINASYSLNYIVHNTVWIVGHFHTMVGTAVTLTFMGATYLLSPFIFGRNIFSGRLALWQPYLWFVGMMIFSLSYHIAGIFGMPRRTSSILSYSPIPSEWVYLSQIAMIGCLILFLSGVLFISNIGLTLIKGPVISMNGESLNIDPKPNTMFDNLKIWIIIAVILIIVAYILPFMEIYTRGLSPVQPRLP